MHTGLGQLTQMYLDGSADLDCPANLVPAPGQYLLAHDSASDSPLAVPVYFYDSAPKGFRFAPPYPSTWTIGTKLALRGPLGHGFDVPVAARKIALIALNGSPAYLHGLIPLALKREMETVLLCNSPVSGLPEDVEVQPLQAFDEICKWADFIAIDIARETLNQLKEMTSKLWQVSAVREAQVLIHTPMPCGGLAECGVCAVGAHHDWKMACREGPVFVLKDILK
jgi:dihydroorotate dehydrogenase electron transfer subunit